MVNTTNLFSKKFTDTDGFTVRGARVAHSHRSFSISLWYYDEECFIFIKFIASILHD